MASNLNAWSRAARITDLLWRGRKMTTQEVADDVEVCYTTAMRMMKEISCVVPTIQQDRYDGVWELFSVEE